MLCIGKNSRLVLNRAAVFSCVGNGIIFKRIASPSMVCTSHIPSCKMASKSAGKHHTVSYKPYVKPCVKDHDHKNMKLKRPMSPHLTIYGPTITSMTSIIQRCTGIILTGYALLLAGGTLFLTNGIETYVSMIQSLDLSRFSLLIIKMCLGAPFANHYCNGIRFCLWNAGRMLSKKEILVTAHQSFIGTAVLTTLFVFL